MKMVIIEVKGVREKALFLTLACQPDDMNVFSPEACNWDDGKIIFILRNTAPAPHFQVGIAGRYILVEERYKNEVLRFLATRECRITTIELKNLKAVREFYNKRLRRATPARHEREKFKASVEQAVADYRRQDTEAFDARLVHSGEIRSELEHAH